MCLVFYYSDFTIKDSMPAKKQPNLKGNILFYWNYCSCCRVSVTTVVKAIWEVRLKTYDKKQLHYNCALLKKLPHELFNSHPHALFCLILNSRLWTLKLDGKTQLNINLIWESLWRFLSICFTVVQWQFRNFIESRMIFWYLVSQLWSE